MASFNDIPTELVTEIVKNCTQTIPGQRNDLCDLRLVSRCIHDLATPILFYHLNLDFRHGYDQPVEDISDYIRCQEIVDALASGTTKVFEGTISLSFEPGRIYRHSWATKCIENGIQSTIGDKLFAAILALKKLKRALYRVSEEVPLPVSDTFIQALGVHSKREPFSFKIVFECYSKPQLSFPHLSNLRVIDIDWGKQKEDFVKTQLSNLITRCPNLEILTLCRRFTTQYEEISVNLGEIFAGLEGFLDSGEKHTHTQGHTLSIKRMTLERIHISSQDFQSSIHHFQALQYLGITQIPNGSLSLGKICRELKASKIWLKGLQFAYIDDYLVRDYLTSYSGLEHLELLVRGSRQVVEDPSSFVDWTFKELLPLHNTTLKHLILDPKSKQEIWTTGPLTCDQMKEIVKCQKLKILRLYWSASSNWMNNVITIPILVQWLEIAVQLPELEELLVVPNSRRVNSLLVGQTLASLALTDICNDVISKFMSKNHQRVRVSPEGSIFLNQRRYGGSLWVDV